MFGTLRLCGLLDVCIIEFYFLMFLLGIFISIDKLRRCYLFCSQETFVMQIFPFGYQDSSYFHCVWPSEFVVVYNTMGRKVSSTTIDPIILSY